MNPTNVLSTYHSPLLAIENTLMNTLYTVSTLMEFTLSR